MSPRLRLGPGAVSETPKILGQPKKLDFKFPLTVSCVHFICSSIGAYIAIHVLKAKPLIQVEPEDRWKRIFPMSFVFCMNIVLGNVSLRYIPVSFMQTIKSFTPATTGCLATSTKTILAESLLHGYKFDSINTVYYMAPFATMILALPAMLLEGGGVIDWFYTHDSVFSSLIIILGSGVLAFCLNFSIFYVIHSTTAVTFNVAGNLKVAVAVLVSWLIFRNPISPMNAIGCAITLVGCTFYGYVRHLISQQQAAALLGSQGTNSPRSRVEMLPLVGDKEDKV
uniref:Sugar phosphate transporter domain-containing protein n=1 Tax=Aegilops tauschii TaxID=37682 RepID=R7W9Z2_AEGTA